MFFFSVPPEKKQPKRELVARFETDKMWFFTLCCGTRFAQTGPRTAYGAVFSHRILLLSLSLLQHLEYISWAGTGTPFGQSQSPSVPLNSKL